MKSMSCGELHFDLSIQLTWHPLSSHRAIHSAASTDNDNEKVDDNDSQEDGARATEEPTGSLNIPPARHPIASCIASNFIIPYVVTCLYLCRSPPVSVYLRLFLPASACLCMPLPVSMSLPISVSLLKSLDLSVQSLHSHLREIDRRARGFHT